MAEQTGLTFEEKLKRLNEIVSKIEGNTLPLQESMDLYSEGKKLIEELQKELKEAEEKIQEAVPEAEE